MIALVLMTAQVAFATGTYAPPLSHPVTQDYVRFLESAENALKPVLFRRGTTEACRAFYANLYDGPDLDVRVAFGFMDAPADEGPIVVDGTDYGLNYALDGHARAAFTEWIQRPCRDSHQLCGFRPQPDDPDLFVKVLGTDVALRREVRLRVTHAAATPVHMPASGGNGHHPLQFQFTQRAEENFLGGIGEADAVFYIGHARGGGGPDFAPPILRRDRHVNYDGYYRRVKPGMKKFLHFLKSSPRPARVICLLSCKAGELFVDRFQLHQIAPETMFVTGEGLTGYKSVLLATIVLFDSLLNGRCLTEMRTMLDRVQTLAEIEGQPLPLSHVIRFDGVAPVN